MRKLTQFQVDRLVARAKRDFGQADPLPHSAFSSNDEWNIYDGAYTMAKAEHKAREEFRKTLPKTVEGKELELGDVVRLNDWGFADAIVQQINGRIVLARPYMHCSDVEYSNHKVITYVGLETFSVPIEQSFTLLSRQIEKAR
jgi:hypothetical protein